MAACFVLLSVNVSADLPSLTEISPSTTPSSEEDICFENLVEQTGSSSIFSNVDFTALVKKNGPDDDLVTSKEFSADTYRNFKKYSRKPVPLTKEQIKKYPNELEKVPLRYLQWPPDRAVYKQNRTNVLFEDSSGLTVDEGTHTIIIEDGNLIIDGDLSYGNGGMFGVMLINTTYETKPDNGNIFVNNEVNEFVGIYFSDGGLTSTWKNGTDLSGEKPGFYESPGFDRETIDYLNANTLREQLILTGTLLTRNTLGGSQIVDITGPWGQMGFSDAVRYDLHHIRRYAPVYDPVTNNHENKDYCTKLDGVTCYENKHSFIIRIDENIKNNPPPGFKTSENTSY